jgi:hypothetical protein
VIVGFGYVSHGGQKMYPLNVRAVAFFGSAAAFL